MLLSKSARKLVQMMVRKHTHTRGTFVNKSVYFSAYFRALFWARFRTDFESNILKESIFLNISVMFWACFRTIFRTDFRADFESNILKESIFLNISVMFYTEILRKMLSLSMLLSKSAGNLAQKRARNIEQTLKETYLKRAFSSIFR